MPDSSHLLIPYAASHAPSGRAVLRELRLPNLGRLLGRLARTVTDRDDPAHEHPRAMPHERALARALGLPPVDGLTPWAAWQRLQAGQAPGHDAWAWFTPCHWQVGMDQVILLDPEALQLSEAEAQALLAAITPLTTEDGIELAFDLPGRWLARGEAFRDLATASLDRVIGQNVKPWLPAGPGARLLQRLQSELQMLLYTHPVNEARAARGLAPVNAFWLSGAGPLAQAPAAPGSPPQVADGLRASALREDWAAWAQAWQRLDAEDIARLLATQQQTGHATLTLCSEHSAQTFEAVPLHPWTRMTRLFKKKPLSSVLEAL